MPPPESVANADRGVTPAKSELAVVVHNVVPKNSDSSRQMFFDLGSFKQEQRGDVLGDKLAQAGFPASVVRKGHSPWMNSYTVPVGPYDNEATKKRSAAICALVDINRAHSREVLAILHSVPLS